MTPLKLLKNTNLPKFGKFCRSFVVTPSDALSVHKSLTTWLGSKVGVGSSGLLKFYVSNMYIAHTLPETNSLPLKMDGWNTTFLLGRPIFRGYVSFREGKPLINIFISVQHESCSRVVRFDPNIGRPMRFCISDFYLNEVKAQP